MDLMTKYYAFNGSGIGVTNAEAIVFEIVSDMNGRRGIGFEEVDSDIQCEILEKWISIVESKTTATYDPTANVTESND